MRGLIASLFIARTFADPAAGMSFMAEPSLEWT